MKEYLEQIGKFVSSFYSKAARLNLKYPPHAYLLGVSLVRVLSEFHFVFFLLIIY